MERAEPLEDAREFREAVLGKRALDVRAQRGLPLDQERHEQSRVGLRDEPIALRGMLRCWLVPVMVTQKIRCLRKDRKVAWKKNKNNAGTRPYGPGCLAEL